MMTYLDTCVIIYWIEGPAPFDARVRTHAGCTSFLTNDLRLAGFPDIAVDVLP